MENKTISVKKKSKFPKVPDKMMTGLLTGATAAGMAALAMPMVFAGGTSEAITAITTLVKYIGILLGVVYGIFGFLHYAAANAEGDGPGKNKAQNQLAAALMLIAIGVIVGLVKWENIIPTELK
mgnify:FL=1